MKIGRLGWGSAACIMMGGALTFATACSSVPEPTGADKHGVVGGGSGTSSPAAPTSPASSTAPAQSPSTAGGTPPPLTVPTDGGAPPPVLTDAGAPPPPPPTMDAGAPPPVTNDAGTPPPPPPRDAGGPPALQRPSIEAFRNDGGNLAVGTVPSLYWYVTGTQYCALSESYGNLTVFNITVPFTPRGDEALAPVRANANLIAHYTLTCSNAAGTAQKSIDVPIDPPTPSASLTVDPGGTIFFGWNVTYTLSSSNAKSCVVSDENGTVYVAATDNIVSKTVTGVTGVGTHVFSATCYSGLNGSGVASPTFRKTVEVVCGDPQQHWDGSHCVY